MPATIAILGSFDTKWQTLEFLAEHIKATDCGVLRIDVSLGGEAGAPTEISSGEVAKAGGEDISVIRSSTDTNFATNSMLKGAKVVVKKLYDEGRIAGIISIGGASNTGLATKAMGALPFGVPKFMVSSMAAVPAYAGSYFGTKDLTMLHSVVDIAEPNPLIENILLQAAGGICGMVKGGAKAVSLGSTKSSKPRVAITEFKFSENCCRHATTLLMEAGVEVIPFHAQGLGDRAMEELVGQGLFDGVLDIVPAGLAEEYWGGNRSAGKERLDAAARLGVPLVITPCGMDMLSCGPLSRRDNNDQLWNSKNLNKRKLFIPDELRVQARSSKEELLQIADIMAEKLNNSKGPVQLIIPQKGWSSLSEEGAPLCDFDTDEVFSERITQKLESNVGVTKVAMALNNEAFAEVAVKALLGLMNAKNAAKTA
jgi:uncharacterized protein (UPF0261 family)